MFKTNRNLDYIKTNFHYPYFEYYIEESSIKLK